MAIFAQDFDLEAVDIIADNGEAFKIKYLVVELNFFEDIFSFSCSGNVVIKDAIGIIEKLKLDGSEIIQITYGKTKDSAKVERKFRLYKVGNRTPVGNKFVENYTLHFTSEELFLSEQLKISKSFSGMTISEMIYKIMGDSFENNGLNADRDRIKIQPSYGLYDMLVPKLKPFEAISWLSNYAIPEEGAGADMVFFENKNGFYFASIRSLFNNNPVTTYKYQPSDFNESKLENLYTILNYEFVKTYDSLEATKAGLFANRLISIDPLSRTKTVTDFNKGALPGYPSYGTSQNRFGKYSEEMYESNLKLVFTNSSQVNEQYINQSPGSIAKNIRIETFVPHRTAQIGLANYTVMKAIVPGNSNLVAGQTLDINLNSISSKGSNDVTEDTFYSGKYLITAVRHIIQTQGVYQTVLELAKDTASMDNYSSQAFAI
jgi:hypothetical protein